MAHSPLRRVLSVIRRQIDPDASGPAADERLLTRFANGGDASAFELLVWRHGSMVLGVCRRVLGDHQLAEDAFQATFLALARKPKAVRNGASLAGWLHRVGRRIAMRVRIDNAKRFERDRRAARCELVSNDGFSADTQAVIDEEIDRLPEKLRRAIVLCYLEGQSAEQAAQLLACPRGTVLSRLAAARERLRARLTRRGLGVPIAGLAAGLATAEISAAVVSATTATALTGGASIQVIGWANGVLYAMFLSKIKFATAAVLTTGMLGAGVGWVAAPGDGPGIVGETQAAQNPVALRATQERDEAIRQRQLAEQARMEAEQAKVELQKALADVQRAQAARKVAETKLAEALQAAEVRDEALRNRMLSMEKQAKDRQSAAKSDERTREEIGSLEQKLQDLAAQQMDQEKSRTADAIQYRMRLAREEERLKALERAQAAELEPILRGIADARLNVDSHKLQIVELTHKLGPNHPDTLRAQAGLDEVMKRAREFQNLLTERQAKGLADRLGSREAIVQLEEESKLSERQRAIADQELSSKRAALQDRLRQTGNAPPSAANDRTVELERKLDALMREVSELRRELKK